MKTLLFLILLAPALAASQATPDVKRGQSVYAAQKCQVCHAVAGTGNKTAPLDGVASKLSAEDLRAWVVDPVTMAAKAQSAKKPPMPKKWASLPPADLDALVAYLQTLK